MVCVHAVGFEIGERKNEEINEIEADWGAAKGRCDEIGAVIMEENGWRRSEIERESVPEWSVLVNAVQETS